MTAAVLLAACLGAGCAARAEEPQVASAGGGATTSAADTAEDQAVSDEDRMRKFAACMREHGVDLPDPEPGAPVRIGGPGADQDVLREAMDACRSLMPNGGEPPKLSPEDLEKARAMAACMREHGVDVPDPDPEGGGAVRIRPGDGAGIPDREALDKALEACRHLGPQLGRAGAPGATSPGDGEG